MPDKVQLHAIIHGRVQGVFFRDTAKRFAEEFGICGSVKNLPDGTVEMIAQGEKEAIEKLLDTLKEHPGMASISKIDKTFGECKEEIQGFHVNF